MSAPETFNAEVRARADQIRHDLAVIKTAGGLEARVEALEGVVDGLLVVIREQQRRLREVDTRANGRRFLSVVPR